jgi:hypothetical protein
MVKCAHEYINSILQKGLLKEKAIIDKCKSNNLLKQCPEEEYVLEIIQNTV